MSLKVSPFSRVYLKLESIFFTIICTLLCKVDFIAGSGGLDNMLSLSTLLGDFFLLVIFDRQVRATFEMSLFWLISEIFFRKITTATHWYVYYFKVFRLVVLSQYVFTIHYHRW